MTEDTLGTMTDRYTIRHERMYPHRIEDVWTVVTTGASLDAWMMPSNRIDARRGGTFWMSFTEGPDAGYHGTIGDFREHEIVEYVFDNGERMRFELSPTTDGTMLVFVHSFTPEIADQMGEDGAQQMFAGWHMCLDRIGKLIDGDPSVTAERALEGSRLAQSQAFPPEMQMLIERYADVVTAGRTS